MKKSNEQELKDFFKRREESGNPNYPFGSKIDFSKELEEKPIVKEEKQEDLGGLDTIKKRIELFKRKDNEKKN